MTPIEVEHLIKDKCDEWLNPMGYSLHASTSESLIYSNDNPDINWPWPIIYCKIEPNEDLIKIVVDLVAGGSSLNNGLMQIEINGLSFKHPNIVSFISDLRYISNCVQSIRSNPIARFYIKEFNKELQDKLNNK